MPLRLLLIAAHGIGHILFLLPLWGMADWGQTSHSWWRNVAVIASVISILGLILFWINPPTAPIISAFIFNALVLVALLLVHFPAVDAVSA